MKKLLIPLLCCLVAAWACNMEGSYSAQNVQDIVTVAKGQLVNDNGVRYTISDVYKDAPALEEGKRYYIVFDILNINYDISVRSVTPIQVIVPVPASDQEEITAHDPIDVVFNWVGTSYLDLGYTYYYNEQSNCAHDLLVRYNLTNGDSVLNLFLYHDGNDENPAAMAEKDLKTGTRIISIPVSQWNLSGVNLTMDVLINDGTGKYTVERQTYSSH